MAKKRVLLLSLFTIMMVTVIGCGKAKNTNTNTATNENENSNSAINTNTNPGEAPFTMSGTTKVFTLKLVNGVFNYNTMTFYAGDNVQVTLTSDNQPVDFIFVGTGARSTSGVFSTNIVNTDPGGTYQLQCADRACGSMTVTVINLNPVNSNTNNTNATNTSGTNGITNVELQRIPVGTTFNPSTRYTTTTDFKIGDQFGFGATGTFSTGAKLTFSVADSAGQVVDGPSMEFDLINGTNGNCCFALPSTAGQYSIKFNINGTEASSVPITITE
ncbi:MAG: hypothetical protein WC497_02285 [Patescibacteria group bacterium]